jgi:glutamine amidotransferase PdxT
VRPVVCREGNVFVCSFHPELTDDTRLHHEFFEAVRASL